MHPVIAPWEGNERRPYGSLGDWGSFVLNSLARACRAFNFRCQNSLGLQVAHNLAFCESDELSCIVNIRQAFLSLQLYVQGDVAKLITVEHISDAFLNFKDLMTSGVARHDDMGTEDMAFSVE